MPENVSASGQPQFYFFPASQLLRAAAGEIIAQNRQRLPDLSGVKVLLPNLHGATPFAKALIDAAALPALLLPGLTTLEDWVATVPLPAAFLPDSRREVELYEALREQRWFDEGDLWHVSGELLRLVDELSRHRVSLPDNLPDFVARLEAAYHARAGESMQFEARIAFEAWRAMAGNTARADAVACYHLRLSHLAAQPPGPLVLIEPHLLTPAEREFLLLYAKKAPVSVFVSDPEGGAGDDVSRFLNAVWRPVSGAGPGPDLKRRAEEFREASPQSPLAQRVSLFGARSLEEEAHAADVRVRAWLLQGKERIAVVAQDRLVARRLRALLERAQVLVEDETGWTLSTVSASTVIMRWLDCLETAFYYQDLLDLLKSPFIFSDWPAERRKRTASALEQAVREKSVVSHLDRYLPLVAGQDASEAPQRLAVAARLMEPRPRPLSGWLASLTKSLDALGITPGLKGDAAGLQLLQLLECLGAELQGANTRFAFAEWRHWLERKLEGETFRDRDIQSPLIFTHLAATRLREFDAVVLLGCDAAHFPGTAQDGLFFNQAVRRELGLPAREQELEEVRRDLIGLIARSREVFATWQATKDAEQNLVAPHFELLEAFHRLAYGDSLVAAEWARTIPHAQVRASKPEIVEASGHGVPRPRAAPDLIPDFISPTGYNSLVACPYQFYARHLLKLNELDEVREELEKRDYGEYVHRILLEFHRRHPSVTGKERRALVQDLKAISDRVFAESVEADYLARAWALRWEALIPSYLDWQQAREAEGWRFVEGEVVRAIELSLAEGRAVTLRGRLDRLDVKEEGGRMKDAGAKSLPEPDAGVSSSFIPHPSSLQYAVVDYKAQNRDALRKKLAEPGEDVQLPAYALLQEGVTQAEYLSVDKDRVTAVAPPWELAPVSVEVRERLVAIFNGLHAGAPLPANGDPATCAYCEMRGLCRKDYWNDSEGSTGNTPCLEGRG